MVFKPEIGDAWLRSPHTRPCLTVEGDADAIEAAGQAFLAVGSAMRAAAVELGKLSREESYRAQSFDAIRDEAGQAEKDLEQAALRYVGEEGGRGTAHALCDYAVALRRVQFLAGEEHVESIRTAHEAAQRHRSALAAAQSEVDGLGGDPTSEERTAAEDRLTETDSLSDRAESLLEGLWENFDSAVGDWEASYDDAVSAIGDAIDLSDIDDSWWEDALDGVILAATIVGAIAAIAAMVVAAPFVAIAATIATIAGLIVLIATIVMAVGGRRKDGVDIAFAVIGVIPFGRALRSGQGARAALGLTTSSSRTAATAVAGRAAIVDDLARWQAHGARHSDVLANVGNRAAREAGAAGLADDFLRSGMPDWAQRIATGVRSGGGRYDIDAMRISSLIDNGWAAGGTAGPRSLAWAADNAMPSAVMQGVNAWNFTMGGLDSVTMGGASDVVADPIRDVIGAGQDAVTGR